MNCAERLFGTDGIRARYGEWPLTEQGILAVSMALGTWLHRRYPHANPPRVLIGKDPRVSGDAIERLLVRGLRQRKVQIESCGVVPTPGLAYLTTVLPVHLGIMISASHNAAADNGIKCFSHNGFKLREREEQAVERQAFAVLKQPLPPVFRRRHAARISTQPYLSHLAAAVAGLDLTGMTIAVDCAHGAVSGYAEELFRGLGARVRVIHNKPNGLNINQNAGSLHPQRLADLVRACGADAGFSFDGDGDRVICVDEQGHIRDGDYMLAIVARFLKEQGCLKSNTVVTTSMSNFGLEQFLAQHKIRMIRTEVGDKYVLEQMQRCGSNLGGEQSGHIIFLDHATTGDGLMTAAHLLRIMRASDRKLSALARGMKKYPQVLLNTRVSRRQPLAAMPAVQARIREVEGRLAGNGRVVVRYSGTELLARVMVEGPQKKSILRMARAILSAIQEEVGAHG